MLIVVQVTITGEHPVKADDFKVIVKAYSQEMRAKISRKIILFMIPVDGALCPHLPLHTKDGHVITDSMSPMEAKYFKQWIFRRTISGL